MHPAIRPRLEPRWNPTPAKHMTQNTLKVADRPLLVLAIAMAALVVLSPVARAEQARNELGTVAQTACAPAMILSPPEQGLQIVGSENGDNKFYYGPADTLIINGGTAQGVQPGQEFYVRRVSKLGIGQGEPIILATAGWIRIIAADEHNSIASVTRPCTGIRIGDFLTPFALPVLPSSPSEGEPDYANPGEVLFGRDGRVLLGEGHYALISLGSNDGLTVGQRMTVFRNPLGEAGPVSAFGSAVVVRVDSDVSTIRLIDTRNAVEAGDLIAPHR